jgi:hypothetical protein
MRIRNLLDGHAHRRIPDALSRRQIAEHLLLNIGTGTVYVLKQEASLSTRLISRYQLPLNAHPAFTFVRGSTISTHSVAAILFTTTAWDGVQSRSGTQELNP